MSGRRQERLADQIRSQVALIVTEELQDPRIGFSTVTRVELSADLGHARLFVSVLGDAEAQAATLRGLASASGYLPREVTHRLGLRRAPAMTFVLDHGPEESLRLEAMLEDLRKDKA